jgi:hypothetical protein
MAENINPTGNNNLSQNFLPKNFRTDSNKKFLQATIEQLIKPGSVKKINGFVGRENAKSVIKSDVFVDAPSQERRNYQLEPSFTVNDTLDNVTFFKDYQDYIHQLSVFGGDVTNHSRLNSQEFYSWDPHIDWDKFVNFQNYYWLPNGPSEIKIYGQAENIISRYSVKVQNNGDNNVFVFTPNGLTQNPILTLYRGQTYEFDIKTDGHPFSIKTERQPVGYDLSGVPVEQGILTFTVPNNSPDVIYYQSSTDIDVGGVIHVLNVNENSSINVETEILGKKQYQTSSGIKLSNGMKVSFGGKVVPEEYSNKTFYVEGVGSAIQLVDETVLELVAQYSISESILFDSSPFDKQPFSEATSYAGTPDYIVINRASNDRNPWSRYNRWFHKDVIETSAAENNTIAELDQTYRAVRPIIEFEPNLKLENFGTISIDEIDLIDTYTTDAFSMIEGSFGYNVDGIDLVNGHKIIFTNDSDVLVKNKVFEVEMVDVIRATQTKKLTVPVTGTTMLGNTVIVSSTQNMEVGQPIRFSGIAFGNIIPDKTYYILGILNSTSITISGSVNGEILQQIDALGSMTAFSVYETTSRQIHLVEVVNPAYGHVALIHAGKENQGLSYWFNGSAWIKTQQKLTLNQPPKFDIFDSNGDSYSDEIAYPGTTFNGTEIFSYKVGTGTNDSILGFPLSYRTINNVGDIVFNFTLATDTMEYEEASVIKNKKISVGYLLRTVQLGQVEYVNGWQKNNLTRTQAAIRIYKDSQILNNFTLDIFDNLDDLDDLVVKAYVNGKRLSDELWYIATETTVDTLLPIRKIIILETDLSAEDVLSIKAYAKQPINSKGHYEIPINLQNNPLNGTINDFTLGEVIDHVSTIVDATELEFTGTYPGNGNLRDLGNATQYGTRFVQHSGPASLSLYHITSKTHNIVRAIEKSREDYNIFKKNFITVANSLGVDTDTVTHVDLILHEINKNKPTNAPYYFSDMVPFSAKQKTTFTVIDYRNIYYPLKTVFDLSKLSTNAVGVYLNDTQLLHGRDYTFNNQGFVVISATLKNDDKIVIYEYESTDGSFVPETPTKLGIWPKYEPKTYLDTSYVTPQIMIQGHDGSQVLAYGDYRDELILELEKRIYNNIKVEYNPDIYDINDVIPSYNRTTPYSLSEFNKVLSPSFYKWLGLIDRDFTKPLSYDENNSFTFNYRGQAAPNGTETPGYWRGIYRWLLDSDRPNVCPWEMLGFTEEPIWWTEVYGIAPYTSDNLILWNDIKDGIIREPNKPIIKNEKYAKPFIIDRIPVDNDGNLLSPRDSGLAIGIITGVVENDFVFGDVSPVESSWRRSSFYPFSVLIASILLTPSKTFGVLLDRSRIVRDLTGQLVYKDTNLRITPKDIQLPSIYSSDTRLQTSGIINYIVNYILSDNLKSYSQYKYDLTNIASCLSYRVGSFTSKEKFNLLLDSKNPTSSGSVFVPQENYKIIVNRSSPIKKIDYSGVIITKLSTGFEVKGYNRTSPFFTRYEYLPFSPGVTVNVGGISESYTTWAPRQQYAEQKIVFFNQKYYRVKTTHTAKDEFEPLYFTVLNSLPIIGGVSALFRRQWNKTFNSIVPYGTVFETVQDVVDFLLGYGEWLSDQGFEFDEFSGISETVKNWDSSAKEFMFWTTQKWSAGQDKWEEWDSNLVVRFGSIVRYNGDYYRAIRTVPPSATFDYDAYVKIDGLSSVGSSVISLSPAAAKITFDLNLTVVDDINDAFNGYEIFRVDGTPISSQFLNSYREDNSVSYIPSTEDGIYGASFFLVQDEHVVILDNTTMFNDVIYSPVTGYKQDRIKVAGYVSNSWNGSFNVPGFIFDQAKVNDWQSWTSYALGDIVKFKQFYYSSLTATAGSQTFNPSDWVKLDEKPTPSLLPNWSYKAAQFTDFYDLDSDNFDIGQQKMAQHLIGYQKRQYLENIIQNDVSEFKFYQGMITEKGTTNVLNKLFDVLSSDGQESIDFYEEWALRVGQYGASAAFETIEFNLDESLFKNNPQGFELVTVVDTTKTDFIIRQNPSQIYLKPLGYNSNPWPILEKENVFLRSSGYVRTDEVLLTLKSIDDIVNYNVDEFTDGDYVWCTFESFRWNVYRYTNINLNITNVIVANGQMTITTDSLVQINEGSYIGIDQTTDLNGFYKVISVELNTVIVSAPDLQDQEDFSEYNTIIVYNFKSQRAISINTINGVLPRKLKDSELVWTDDDGQGRTSSWVYSPVYTGDEIVNFDPLPNGYYGRDISVNIRGNLIAISTAAGEVLIFDKASLTRPWTQRQVILPPYLCSDIEGNSLNPLSSIAKVVAISPDERWLATGSPEVGNVESKFNGDYNPNIEYLEDDIVVLELTYYRALTDVPRFTSPDANTSFWEKIPYIPVEDTGFASSLYNQGVISIYEKDINNIYTLVNTIISPVPSNNEQFGSSISFGNNELFVTATTENNAGKVYNLVYADTVQVTAFYNPNGSTGTTLKVSNTDKIKVGMKLSGVGFISSQTVINIVDDTTLLISNNPDSQPDGIIEFITTGWKYNRSFELEGTEENSYFGKDVVISSDYSTLVITSPSQDGRVFVYKKSNGVYSLIQEITGSRVHPYFGRGVAVSNTGDYIAISDVKAQGEFLAEGVVYVYSYDSTLNEYQQYQRIANRAPEPSQDFGNKLFFANDSKTLIIFSSNADSVIPLTFDSNTTTFDNNSTAFVTNYIDSGRVDVYDRYDVLWVYSESLKNSNVERDSYGASIAVCDNSIFVGAPYVSNQYSNEGKVYQYIKTPGQYSWTINHTIIDKPDVYKIKQAFLYNKKTNDLITYLDVIDPSQGKYPGIADQEIKYKSFYDPATYSTGNSQVNVDEGVAWSTDQVGALWWDLRTVKFINSYDNDIVYRNSNWNTLAIGASVDIYEWVETSLLPSEWDADADTEVGLSLGISGTSLYGDTVYSLRRRYDNISRTFRNTYYYWVKNKKTIPNVIGRKLAASSVANLIANPRGEGYQYLALTGSNSFSLVNVKNLLSSTDVVLSVEYWTVDAKEQNIHSQWKLISNSISTNIPNEVESKWIDSLCGKDIEGRKVPDLSIPFKLRYGIENRPMQTMFVNRFEALKQLIEQANIVLKNNMIAKIRDISSLKSFDPEPNIIRGLYDTVRDTEKELRFEVLNLYSKPVLTPIIVDGRVTGVNIVSSGRGYVTAPYIEVYGSGKGASIRSKIDSLGRFIGYEVISSGQGYDDNTVLTVRNYSVLVHSDSEAGNVWSIYSFDKETRTWSRSTSQTYNTTKYWNYIDWYATDVNQFSIINHAVDTYSDLVNLEDEIGELIKVRVADQGNWTLLRKYAESSSYDWTQSYKVVGIQNGTIQLSSTLYEFTNSVVGYDGLLYDGGVFDNGASNELRIILNSLKDKIFVDDLKLDYLNLFFTSVRYALSEQVYVDWIFKTSFVKAQHNVGQLHQAVTYKNDNLQNFEDYISEVKPYRTQIREYVSSYLNTDVTSTAVTDFDLPPIDDENIISAIVTNDVFNISNPEVQQYPWKFWLDNVGFSVTAIKIIDGGSGYINRPVVRVVGKCSETATVSAFITNGKLSRIVIINPGKGYLSAPTIYIEGGISAEGSPARAVSIIGDSLVRTNTIKMKFDRISNTPLIAQLEETETFISNGNVQYALTWGPDIRIGLSSVSIDGVDVLRDLYTLKTTKNKVNGETKYFGTVTFSEAPKNGSTIIVKYRKDWDLLSAADRIQYYYTPESGGLGNDLSQLMTGVDYGGVIVTGLGFESTGGWGSSLYSSESWDNYDSEFDDYIVKVAGNTHDFTLPYTPDQGTKLNVYYAEKEITSYVSDGQQTEYDFNLYAETPSVSISKIASIVTPINVSANIAGSNLLYIDDTTNIQVGDVVTDMTNFGSVGRILITGTNKDSNYITVTETTNLKEDMPIYVHGASIGGLVEGMYYILTIENNTTITVSQTTGGSVFDIIKTETGIQTIVYGIFNFNTTVLEVVSTNIVKLNQPIYSDISLGDEVKFSRQLDKFNGISSFSPKKVVLTQPIPTGMTIEVDGYLQTIRLDDLDYGTPEQTNDDAIMATVIANGTSNQVSIPLTFTINNGDIITIRKSTSDGSRNPVESEYDTALSGGDLTYSTALGIAADDIIIDGDDFVTATTSPATEEVVPGQVVDAVGIKVFDRALNVQANVKVDNFVSNGTQLDYVMSIPMNSSQSTIVKVIDGSSQLILSINEDYIADIQTNSIKFITAPALGSIISIFTFGYNGYGILELNSIISNGVDTVFVSDVAYDSTFSGIVYVDGTPTDASIFDNGDYLSFRVSSPPVEGSIITYIVTNVIEQTVSITKTQRILANGSDTYTLTNISGTSLPIENSMLIRINDSFLTGPNNSYFDIKSNRLNYSLNQSKVPPYSASISDFIVYADGDELVLGLDYTVDLSGVVIKITRNVYNKYSGNVLTVTLKNGYTYSEPAGIPTIVFDQTYSSPDVIEVITSYNHTSLDMHRTTVKVAENKVEYFNEAGNYSNEIILDRAVLNDSYVWVTKNGSILTPSVDFKLKTDRKTITLLEDRTLADNYEVITFGSNLEFQTISYMQFKDMLNRVHYKRLNQNKITKLTKDLKFSDTTIEVEDASILELPQPGKNKPGIIEIRGERIEFFKIEGNTLGQLRRSTLGTGCPTVHKTGAIVQDIGPSETLPYLDKTVVSQHVADGTHFVDINFVPVKVAGNWEFDTSFNSTIPQFYDQSDEIEVFVGGYNDSVAWSSSTPYKENDIVKVGSYTYRCAEDHTSSSLFKDDMTKWKFFVGNIRLKKAPYKIHDVNKHPYSTTGDVQFDPDFSVNGYSKQIRLTNVLDPGTLVTVVKRTGVEWGSSTNIRENPSKVAEFIRSVPGSWYSIIKQ